MIGRKTFTISISGVIGKVRDRSMGHIGGLFRSLGRNGESGIGRRFHILTISGRSCS